MSHGTALIQQGLASLGYDPGPLDGLPGPRTFAAVDAYRAAMGLPKPAGLPPAAHEWDTRSARSLQGVHPDLVRVATLARSRSAVPFVVTEGLRTRERQAQLVKSGASQTMNSRHLTGHAIDVAAQVGGKVSWDWPLYERIAVAMKQAAEVLGIRIVWGGDWLTFKDGPHYELNRTTYPG